MKLQILELPTEYVGDYSKTPYAVIVSEVPSEAVEGWGKAMETLKRDSSGTIYWTLVTEEKVEL